MQRKHGHVGIIREGGDGCVCCFLMIRRQPRSTHGGSSAASDVYKRQPLNGATAQFGVESGVGQQAHERGGHTVDICLLYTSPSPRDRTSSRMPSSA